MSNKVEQNIEHYKKIGYDYKGRFASYWHQINEILILEPEAILEIGIGNGLVSNYLKSRNYNITTLDIDERLNPDCVGLILNLPFPDNSFKVVASYEVLEHLPYEDALAALKEVHRVTNEHALLSLPDSTRVYRLDIQIPKIGEFKRLMPLPRLKPPKHKIDCEHYWEIGKAAYPLRKVMGEFRKVGFETKNTYRVFENPYHRFFILRKEK